MAALISHAAQERLKNLVEKLALIAEHRIDLIKVRLKSFHCTLQIFVFLPTQVKRKSMRNSRKTYRY